MEESRFFKITFHRVHRQAPHPYEQRNLGTLTTVMTSMCCTAFVLKIHLCIVGENKVDLDSEHEFEDDAVLQEDMDELHGVFISALKPQTEALADFLINETLENVQFGRFPLFFIFIFGRF